ncbi:MAG: tetratricopeptide repeat protein [Vicinamibacterales bacterium]
MSARPLSPLGVVAALWCAAAVQSCTRSETSAATPPTGADPAVTFTRDVAPIVFAHCAPCHRPGEAAPFPLLTYAQVRQHASQMSVVTKSRYMPPWQPSASHGVFVGERRLTEEQIATLDRWASTGAVEGDPTELPPTPQFVEGWQLGQPDIIVTMPQAFDVPADGADVFRKFAVPVTVDGRRYVRGVEFRPDNPRVVHHAVLRVDQRRSGMGREVVGDDPGEGGMLSGEDTAESPDGHFMGWTPGHAPTLEDPGMAWPLEPGSDLVFELHLKPTGKPERIRASVGFFLSDTPPTLRPVALQLGSYDIDIPAGNSDYRLTDEYVLPVDVEVRRVYPHAHYLGKRINAYATRPDGSTTTLVRIDNWNFNWQDEYRFITPLALPKGTRLTMEYVYDNSDANPRNPSHPARRVRYGGLSTDEMGNLWMQVLPRTASDRATLRRHWDRKALLRRTAGIERLLEANPRHVGMLRSLGSNYLALGHLDRAVPVLLESLRIDAGDPYVHFNLGSALAAQGKRQEAANAYRRAIDLKPDYAEAMNNLALVLRDAGRVPEAVSLLERAVAANPAFEQAHNNLGSFHRSTGRLADARREFETAVRLAPDYADALANLAAIAATEGDTAASVAYYRRALAADADHVSALGGLAWLLATRGSAVSGGTDEAVRAARHAVELTRQGDASALDTLAAALASAGLFAEAVGAGERALALATRDGDRQLTAEIESRLALYRQGRRYRER